MPAILGGKAPKNQNLQRGKERRGIHIDTNEVVDLKQFLKDSLILALEMAA